jgi:hypothetical protein
MLRSYLLLIALVSLFGCNRALNDPKKVALIFLEGISSGSTAAIDTLVAWDKVLIEDSYTPVDYFKAQSNEKKKEIIQSYREIFFNDKMPSLRNIRYEITALYIARGTADTPIKVTFPPEPPKELKQREGKFTLRMMFYPEKKCWYIVNFGNLLRLNTLRGDFDIKHYYLTDSIPPAKGK